MAYANALEKYRDRPVTHIKAGGGVVVAVRDLNNLKKYFDELDADGSGTSATRNPKYWLKHGVAGFCVPARRSLGLHRKTDEPVLECAWLLIVVRVGVEFAMYQQIPRYFEALWDTWPRQPWTIGNIGAEDG